MSAASHLEQREVGDQAIWSLSTAKPGNGVEQLRDDNIDTYWQSDGPQPHLINIQFHKRMPIQEISIYTEFKLDESYTPSKLSIRAGTTFHDLQEIHVEELTEPSGWVTILRAPSDANAELLRTHFIQVAILANHQNGRDTHIRQVKVYTPRRHMGQHMSLPEFNTIAFQQYACLR
ncbi:hypothetical protein AB1Y20_006200 [Prymnesium parvum]|uniref:Anaphase-promoting complex subunit 10 n=1 Tax=Prymnesium parvum TaxID=97485 RepID=A0AB34J216_PRYPA